MKVLKGRSALARAFAFFKGEAVLSIAFICAALSMLLTPPDAGYAAYIDLRVLCLLFCLMAVVAGLRDCGVFDALSSALLTGRKSGRAVGLILVLLPFFASMLVTNDVALLTFVPFAALTLRLTGRTDELGRVVVLQTVAANLGSMATPVGNPQNLYLYSAFGMGAGEFFSAVLPPAAISLAALAPLALFACRGGQVSMADAGRAQLPRARTWLFAGLFVLCLLAVFRAAHYAVVTAIVAFCLLAFAPKLFRKVDWCLLATFVCFFVFSGNLGRVEAVRSFLSSLLSKNTMLASALTSQVISNVPAAVLLSGFTGDGRGLLLGTDIGGLGTPVASLASLIALRLYSREPGARPGRWLILFTVVNFIWLAALLALELWVL